MQNDNNKDPFENEQNINAESDNNAPENGAFDSGSQEVFPQEPGEKTDAPEEFETKIDISGFFENEAGSGEASGQEQAEPEVHQEPEFKAEPEAHQEPEFQPEPEVHQEPEYTQEPEYHQEQEAYHQPEPSRSFSHQKEDIPRWTPYEEPYKTVSKPEKAKKGWVIPLVIVLALMVIGIIVGVVIGARQLTSMVSQNPGNLTEPPVVEEVPTETPAPIVNDPSVIRDTGTGTYTLTDVSEIVEEVMPSVVSITSRALIDTGGFGNYWDFFFGGSLGNGSESREKEEVDAGFGSGTIIAKNDTDLLILTSYHVVEDSSSLYVTFHDGTSVDGRIKSASEADDIAVVAVPLKDISQETLSDIAIAKLSSEPVRVGEGAVVIGNALGYGMSVTSGIISATDREINVDGRNLTVLQTDAPINSGNSGGCLLNSKGEVIGISEAKIIITHVEGMCYAIQISANWDTIQRLLNEESTPETQQIENDAHGAYLGIRGRDIDRSLASSYGMPQGIYVASTVAGSGAEAAGLKEGDIIVGMDNVSFSTMTELQEQLSRHNPGDTVDLIIMREENGSYSQMKVKVTLSDTIS